MIPGSATVSLRTTSLFEKGGQAKGDLGRNRRREQKTAFSGFPPVHGADLKGQLRVESGGFAKVIELSSPAKISIFS